MAVRSMSRPRHWNLLEKLFDDEETACQSSQSCCSSRSANRSEEKSSNHTTEEGKTEIEVDKAKEGNKAMEPITKTISKRFMSKLHAKKPWKKLKLKSNLVAINSRLKMMKKNLKENSNFHLTY